MIRISCSNTSGLKSFFRLAASDYIEVLVRERSIMLISNTSELMVYLELPITARDSEPVGNFRLHKNIASKSFITGILDVRAIGDSVEVIAADDRGSALRRLKFKQQIVATSAYEAKLELVRACISGEYSAIDFGSLSELVRYGKSAGAPLQIYGDYACVALGRTEKMFADTTIGSEFSINSRVVAQLMSGEHTIYSATGYLVAVADGAGVVVKKLRTDGCENYFALREERSCYKAVVSFAQLFSVLNTFRLEEGEILLDFNRKEFTFTIANTEITTPLVVIEEQRAAALQEIPIRKVSVKYLQTIGKVSNDAKFTLEIHKRFTSLVGNKIYLIY